MEEKEESAREIEPKEREIKREREREKKIERVR